MLPQRRFSKHEPRSGAAPGPGTYFSYARSVAAQRRARVTLRELARALAVGLLVGTTWLVLFGGAGAPRRGLGFFASVLISSVGGLVLRPVFAGLSSDNYRKASRTDAETGGTPPDR